MSFSELLGLSEEYHAKPRFQELQSRLGNQSGCENSLSYTILMLNFVTVKDDPSLLKNTSATSNSFVIFHLDRSRKHGCSELCYERISSCILQAF